MKTRIHGKGLGSLSSFSFLKSSNGEQLTEDEQELLAQINPRKFFSSHTPRRSSWPANHN